MALRPDKPRAVIPLAERLPCTCEHAIHAHEGGAGPCLVAGCKCKAWKRKDGGLASTVGAALFVLVAASVVLTCCVGVVALLSKLSWSVGCWVWGLW